MKKKKNGWFELYVTVPPQTAEKLTQQAHEAGMTVGRLASLLLKGYKPIKIVD